MVVNCWERSLVKCSLFYLRAFLSTELLRNPKFGDFALAKDTAVFELWPFCPLPRVKATFHVNAIPSLATMAADPPNLTNSPNSKPDLNTDDDFLSNMALYNLSRIQSTLAFLSAKPTWSASDTAPFDHMHYDGSTALDLCASKLALQPNQHILDIGSGFSATGRYLATTHGVQVTGIELQKEIHDIAETIIGRNEDPRIAEAVRSVHADFLALGPEVVAPGNERFDHAVSMLCVCHILRTPVCAFSSKRRGCSERVGRSTLRIFTTAPGRPWRMRKRDACGKSTGRRTCRLKRSMWSS